MRPMGSTRICIDPDANYLNGVVMNWLYLLLVLALAGYLLRALARTHE
jgi:hypothetical protein